GRRGGPRLRPAAGRPGRRRRRARPARRAPWTGEPVRRSPPATLPSPAMTPGDAPHEALLPTDEDRAADVTVARVDPPVTYALRSRVLRDGAPPERARLPVDDLPATAAFAATAPDGTVVGTAIVY